MAGGGVGRGKLLTTRVPSRRVGSMRYLPDMASGDPLLEEFSGDLAAELAAGVTSATPLAAVDVAAALITRRPGLDQMQLHKLLYLTQAAHLVWYGEPAFGERIEAWKWGPVVRTVAGHYRRLGATPITGPVSGDDRMITDRVALVLDKIVEVYGEMSGPDLARLVKGDESPWRQVWGDLPDDAVSQREIPLLLISDYYRERGVLPVDGTDSERAAVARFLRSGDPDTLRVLFAVATAE